VARRARWQSDYRGDLQAEIMAAAWRLGEATVEDVRATRPPRRRSAYTTVQTVMNRLVERGLLERERRGTAYVYRPALEEGEFLSRMIGERLADASPPARRSALVHLLDDLEPGELDELSRYAQRIRRARRRPAS
jgi:predicted transcriptional regulator